MGEELLAMVPSDRAVEQALVALKKGAHLLKYGRRGKPKFCPFRLSADEKFLIWYSGQEEKQLRLSSVINIIRGQRIKQLQPERDTQSFSLIYANGERSLDLICKDKVQADTWYLGLKAVITRYHNRITVGVSRNQRGPQSCINSPSGYMRRKQNLGLLEETTKYSQVHSLAGSPAHSFSERSFSDGLSCSSDSFYSESSLSSMQNIKDILIPNSPYIEPEDLRKSGAVSAGGKIQINMLNRSVLPTHESAQIEKNVLRDVFIWGEGISGYLGGESNKISNRHGMQMDALSPKLLESAMMLDVKEISLGLKHAALVTKQGEVFCWGEGKKGRLGHKIDMDVTCPKLVESLTGIPVKSVACGAYQTCALTLSGELYTWGDNSYGADLSGENKKKTMWLPHRLSGPLDSVRIRNIACGDWHTAVISTPGKLFTWGDGTFGVLGHGDLESISQPKEVESLKGLWVKSVACGPWHTAAVVDIMGDHFKFSNAGGKLLTWGDGDKGKLGHAEQERKLLPTSVVHLMDHDFVQVSCGRMLTAGLTSTGVVYTMGSAVHGQLGNPLARDKSITCVEGKLRDEFVTKISSGSYHIVALTSRGKVYTWGKGASGQLGIGSIEDRSSPTLVEALRDKQVVCIASGANSTAAICLHKSISSTDQSTCKGCNMEFGFTRKKHNCYNCGHLFCHACSSKKATNACLAPNKSKSFRVCDPCFKHLQKVSHSCRHSKLETHCPAPILTTQKSLPGEKEERREAAITYGPSISARNCCDEIVKARDENQQQLDPISTLTAGLLRWGQVPCPVSFSNPQTEEAVVSVFASEQCLSFTSSVFVQDISVELKSPTSTHINVKKDLSESDKILHEEVHKLRAQAESLEKLFQSRREKIQEYQLKIEDHWSLAKEEATKCKAANEVIKSLTLQLQIMSEKFPAGEEVKDQILSSLPHIMSKCTINPTLDSNRSMHISPCLPYQDAQVEERIINSLCTSPIVFSRTLKSIQNRDIYRGSIISPDELCGTQIDSGQNRTKILKTDWVEQYIPGVYITFMSLPSGQRGLKRVRFSRKRFTEKEAQHWWDENQIGLYQKYDIEEFISSNQDLRIY